MRVLIITASLNERSGWGRYSTSIIKALRSSGHAVIVLSEDRNEIINDAHMIKKLRSRKSLYALLINTIHARSLAKDVDIVHALDGWPYGVYGYAAVLGTRKKLFMNGVGTYSVAPLYEKGSSLLLRWAYARAKDIFCISTYTSKQIIAAGIDAAKVRTVHMGAPELPLLTSEESARIAHEAGISETAKPIILTVGSIKDRKGQLDTLKAVSILKQKYPNILYIVAGSGNQRDYMENMRSYAASHGLETNLLVLTDADDRTIAGLYAYSTVFALNSNSDHNSHHFEGFGLVVLEAAGYGVPAVGSRNSGVEDAIEDRKTGYLTDQHDPADIAEKIGNILDRYDFFSANAKIWHSRFTWRSTVEAYAQAYAED